MNIRYKTNSIIPFFLVNTFLLFMYASGRIMIENSTTQSISLYINPSSIPLIGIMEEVIPITTSKLNMFEPIKLPMDKSFCFFNDATTDAANSGILVPIATIVMLIILSEISNLFATDIADFMRVYDPSHNNDPLKKIYKNDL